MVLGWIVGVALLAGCATAAVESPTPTGESSPVADGPSDATLLSRACLEATQINTLVRLPDMQIAGQEPGEEPITADQWRESIATAKQRAADLLTADVGPYDSQVAAFASGILAVSETPPEQFEYAPRPELTEATRALNEECIGASMEIGVLVPPSFGG